MTLKLRLFDVTIKLKNIHLNIVFTLQYLQSVAIINRNQPGDESSATEKLSTILFGTGRPEITIKRHTVRRCVWMISSKVCCFVTPKMVKS